MFCAAMFTTSISFAQIKPKYNVGVSAGAFIYQGDLTPSAMGSFKTPGFVSGVNGSRRLSPHWWARLDLNFGQLRGNDSVYNKPEYRKQRAFAFKAPVTEVTLSAVYQPLGNDRRLSPYLFAGIGLGAVRIQRDWTRFNAAYFESEPNVAAGLAADSAHGLPRTLLVMPLGLGINYRLSDKISLYSEASYRIMSSDYLDGFSQSANSSLKDNYSHYSIGVRFWLGGKSKYDCPEVKQ